MLYIFILSIVTLLLFWPVLTKARAMLMRLLNVADKHIIVFDMEKTHEIKQKLDLMNLTDAEQAELFK